MHVERAQGADGDLELAWLGLGLGLGLGLTLTLTWNSPADGQVFRSLGAKALQPKLVSGASAAPAATPHLKGWRRALGDCSTKPALVYSPRSELLGHIDNTMNDERHTGKKTTTPNSPIL